jgi:type IV secretory pathway TrbL component
LGPKRNLLGPLPASLTSRFWCLSPAFQEPHGACQAIASAWSNGAKQDARDAASSTKKAAKKTGHKIKHGTEKAVNKSAKAAKKGAQKLEDKTDHAASPPSK